LFQGASFSRSMNFHVENETPQTNERVQTPMGQIPTIRTTMMSTFVAAKRPRLEEPAAEELVDAIMGDELPVPAQLNAQLGKCKTVRPSDYYKPRTKTTQVRRRNARLSLVIDQPLQLLTSPRYFSLQEMEESKKKLPDLPTASK